MELRRLILITLVAGVTLTQSLAAEPLNLESLIKEGLENNPQRKALGEDIKAAESRVSQASALPDPTLSLNLLNLPISNLGFDQEPMSGKQVAFKQGLPFPGKLKLKAEISSVGVNLTESQYAEATNGLVKSITKFYYDIFYTDEAIATIDKNQQLLREFLKVAEQKYVVGKGLQQDVLKAQVELSLMTERIINLRQKREQLEAGLNQLLNRPVTQDVPAAQRPVFKAQTLSFDQLRELAIQNRPLLDFWKNRLLQSDRKIALARKNLLPDFAVTAAYTQRSVLTNGLGGADFLTTGISLNLPIYARSKQKQQVVEQQIMQKSLEERRESVLQTVERDIDNALTELNKTADLVELYRSGIVPQAGQSLESSLIGYQTDKVDFLTLISSQMTLLKLELEYTRLISTYYKNIAELEFIIGTSLPTN